ncbi:ribosomal protein L11 methyltransferase [Roseovarius sp. 22II1-1F6A]|nr:ribosomal protein L11 methyltransferase [Roseovarius sp. 22II1-1F6A]
MPTYTAFTTINGKRAAETLGEALEELTPEPTGVSVFEIQEDGAEEIETETADWEITAYFIETPDEAGLALLAAAHGSAPFEVTELPETDWIAKVEEELAPVVAGRFFVYGSHSADRVTDGVEPLLIEAGMAFGTGHHGTTLGCLEALDRLIDEGIAPRAVADIGCGTAVLAMAAARIWQVPVLASDIDPVAVEVAEVNLTANDMTGQVQCLVAEGFDNEVLAQAAPFDLIFANILKGPLIGLAPDLCAALAPGGYAILSGILNPQADAVVAAYAAEGATVHQRETIGDWTTLCLKKA